jgi:membrane associated rhomboid family serine protease
MTAAPVGFHCPECIATAHEVAAQTKPRTLSGAQVRGNPILVTQVLIGLNVVAYALQVWSNDRVSFQYVQQGAAIADGDWWRLGTSMFLHASVTHLLLNMVALWWLGSIVEPRLGRYRYLALYLVSGLAGNVLTYVIDPPGQPSLGASGAIFGVFAAAVVLAMRLRFPVKPLLWILALNVLLGFAVAHINWRAHLGGFAAGFVLTAAMVYPPKQQRTLATLAAFAGIGLLLVAATLWRTSSLLGGG